MAEIKEYRWGILGPGKIAHQFAKALQVTDKGKLYAVGSRNLNRAETFANQYGASKTYGSYTELIHDPEVDVIYIATPHHLHYSLSKECIRNQKPVLCEKPITINAAQFQELSQLAKKNEVFYMDALWTRFLPTIVKTMELLEDLGPIKTVRADFGFNASYDPDSRLFNPELGGGSLLDIGIYPVFLVLLLLGEPEKIQSTASLSPTGVDESMAALFTYNNGTLATLYSTFGANTKTEAEIACEKGTIIINSRFHEPSSIEIIKDQNTERFTFDYRSNGYEYEAEEVMRCLDQNLIESPSLDHAFTLRLMKILDVIREQNQIIYPMEKH